MNDTQSLSSFQEAQQCLANAIARRRGNALSCLVLFAMTFATSASAKTTPADLKASAARPWIHHDCQVFTLDLPDYFKHDTSSAPYRREFHRIEEDFLPLDSLNEVRITVSKEGNNKRKALAREFSILRKDTVVWSDGEDDPIGSVVIDSVARTNSYFILKMHFGDSGESTYYYDRGILAPSGVFLINVTYGTGFKQEIEPIIDRIVSSFQTSKT